MSLTGVHILLSYQCTYECDHCFVWSSPRAGGTMTLETVLRVLDQAADTGTVDSIYFEGSTLSNLSATGDEPAVFVSAMTPAVF